MFTDLKTDGFGNLVVTVTGAAGSSNPFLNAVVLQAVPEPSTATHAFVGRPGGTVFPAAREVSRARITCSVRTRY